MKKNVFGRKLKRDTGERTALFKSLMSSLILKESIKTTAAKAKAIRPEIEKLVTKAKKVEKGSAAVLHKSLSVGPRLAKRNGGYTRIIKLGERFGDNAPYVMMELVEKAEVIIPVKQDKKKAEIKPKKEIVVKKEKPVKKIVAKEKKAKGKVK